MPHASALSYATYLLTHKAWLRDVAGKEIIYLRIPIAIMVGH